MVFWKVYAMMHGQQNIKQSVCFYCANSTSSFNFSLSFRNFQKCDNE